MPTLRVIDGPHKGEEFIFTSNRTLVGRDFNNAVQLPEGLVSRHHAEIVRDGDNYVLHDLQSTNGTLVNDTPVTETVLLKDGDIVQMGDVVMTYAAAPAAEEEKISPAIGLKTPIFKPFTVPELPKPVPPSEPPPAAPPEAPKPVVEAKPPAKPVLLKDSPPAPAPAKPQPPVEKVRLYTKPLAGTPTSPARAEEEEIVFVEAPRRKLAPFLITLVAGVGILIAGYTLDANALRFFGLLLMIAGLLCLFHDWSPLPPKPKTQ